MQAFQLPFSFSFADALRFDTFHAGPAQASLLHYLQHFGDEPGQLAWLWGRRGCGKTHLLQSVCHLHRAAIYLPLPRLLEYGPACLDGLKGATFLVLDDVDSICGKREWEEQLFEVCNELLSGRGQLCVAASAPPVQMPFALRDLQSRMQLAVVHEAVELADDDKVRVLIARARERGIELKEDVMLYILARNQRNMHDLMHVLDKLDAQALAEQRRITIPFVKSCMQW
jgi:DnaA family protein